MKASIIPIGNSHGIRLPKSFLESCQVRLTFSGKKGWIVLDQIRTVDRKRLVKNLGGVYSSVIKDVKNVIKIMLVDI